LRGLQDRPRSGRPRKVTRAWERLLVAGAHGRTGSPPRGRPACRLNRPALTEYLAEKTGVRVSAESVRHYLRVHGYAPRRPTWTVQHLARRDPQYASKGPAPRRSK
jgi:transposase